MKNFSICKIFYYHNIYYNNKYLDRTVLHIYF
ncbi:hypothetical protein GGR01_002808 [Acetobacter oeni]|nr:hypothetical protein [Acetobacter oeni]